MNTINIVCDEADGGWIYTQFINQFKQHSKYNIVINENDVNKYSVIYFLPYYTYRKTNKPSTSWQSHQEKKQPLHNKFIAVAKAVDVAISHSQKYAKLLRENHNLTNVISIIPGVDLKRFKLRSTKRAKNNKLIAGFSGRQYSSSPRKNPVLLNKISKLPFIDFKATDGKISAEEMPQWYSNLDICISTGLWEGGPLAIQESLAVGVPILCMENVGVTNEFGEGVIKAKNNDDFIIKLKQIYDSKEYISKWRSSNYTSKLRKQIEKQTWEKFVYEHDKVWQMISTDVWKNSGV